MPKNAFIDPVTKVLKCWGFVQSNAVGDILLTVADDFSLDPGMWAWDGAKWNSYTPPPLTVDELKAQAASQLDAEKILLAFAIWTIQKFGVTLTQARSEIAVIYSQL